jgi:hypothetical protein
MEREMLAIYTAAVALILVFAFARVTGGASLRDEQRRIIEYNLKNGRPDQREYWLDMKIKLEEEKNDGRQQGR